jgi:adenylate cyclase
MYSDNEIEYEFRKSVKRSMKKSEQYTFLTIVFIFHFICSFSQNNAGDSLKALLKSATADTTRIQTMIALSKYYSRISPNESIRYGLEAKEIARRLGLKKDVALSLKYIGMSYYFQGEYLETINYWQQSKATFDSIGDKQGVANMLNNIGAIYFNKGDDNKAVINYLESLRVSEEINDKLRIATALVNLGAVYFNKKATHNLALEYYLKALPLSEELGDQDAIGTSAVNIGEIYLERDVEDSALYYFNKSLIAYQKSESGNIAYTLNSIGKVYAKKKDYITAISKQKEAYEKAKSLNARLEMAQSLLGLATTYEMKGDYKSAVITYQDALLIAENIGANYELKDAYEGLAKSYAMLSDYQNAFKYKDLFSGIKDTLYNAEMDKKLEAMTLSFDIEKKQGEIDLLTKDKALQDLDLKRQKTIRNAIGISGILILFIAIGLFNRYKYVRKTKKIIEDEKERSEKLLLNILPVETAEELKEKGSATPKHYDMVSVLFTDFKGFTNIAEKLTPQQLVEELNQCFMEFDKIIDRNNLEKIKTIGDAYMCAGGIPVANETNPVDIVKAGLEIKTYMEQLKSDREAQGKDYWELRIGIHTGPVIAGVVGKNKFAYDIWGDAVNTASRMESSGIPGQVNISGTTYELVKDQFHCTYRGKIQAKNKGEIDMYIVEKIKINSDITENIPAYEQI